MRPSTSLILASTLLAATVGPTRGDDPQSPTDKLVATTPEARARFDALIAAYRALPAYADQGTVTVVTRLNDKEARQVQKASVAFVRPDRLAVATDLVRVVADGSTVTEVNVPLRKYRQYPSPRPFREAMLRGGPLGSIEFGGMAGLPLAHVLNLTIGHEPERLVEDFAPRLVVEPDREVGGVSYRVLRFDEADNHDWRFLIDPRTGLIAHVDLAIEGDAARASVAGPGVHVASIRWSAGPISTTPPDPSTFQFEAPQGFTAVAPLDAPRPAEK